MRHPSTPAQRTRWIGHALATEGQYGAVTQLSRVSGVPRQTLLRWREEGRHALTSVLCPPAPPPARPLTRAILTLVVDGHASYRGVQRCLAELVGQHVSLGTISAVVTEAGHRAQAWLARQTPTAPRTLALDELFAGTPQRAYLSAVDAQTGAVWATAGPLPADAEAWTLLLWDLQAQGGRWTAVVHDGGQAAAEAARIVDPTAHRGRDVWHVLARWGQTHHRLARRVAEAQARLTIRERYAATRAAGLPWRGRVPTTSLATQAALLTTETRLAEAVGYLGQELRRLLAVVVLERDQVMDLATRHHELTTLLALLAEVAATAPVAVRVDLDRLQAHVAQALPGLLTFAAAVAPAEQQGRAVLGDAGLGLVAWAWQRRVELGLDATDLVAALPPAWRAAAQRVLHAWAGVARTTSLAETWHSLLRPHLVVHRGLTPALLALLAVWHNHRIVARGDDAGTSPLHRSGLADAPTDWLAVLGYPPPGAAILTRLPTAHPPPQEVAA